MDFFIYDYIYNNRSLVMSLQNILIYIYMFKIELSNIDKQIEAKWLPHGTKHHTYNQ